jgi:sec-independent protein translocase protein TatC
VHNQLGQSLFLSGITDGFYLRLKIAIVVGVIIASPVWLYQLWAFVAPGLYAREKRWTYVFLGTSVPLFALGVFFAIQAMSRAMQFFIGFTGNTLSMTYTADTYLSFWVMMVLGFGVIFEVPLFLAMLNLARVITHERFRKWRRVIIFLVFVFAGIASPSPDPMTMLLLGGVVVVLVEAAEVFIFLNDRRYARNHPDLYAGLDDSELAPLDDIDSSDIDSSDTVS